MTEQNNQTNLKSANSQYRFELISQVLEERLGREPDFFEKHFVFYSPVRGIVTLQKPDHLKLNSEELDKCRLSIEKQTNLLTDREYQLLN